jgi:hypothetical protein
LCVNPQDATSDFEDEYAAALMRTATAACNPAYHNLDTTAAIESK